LLRETRGSRCDCSHWKDEEDIKKVYKKREGTKIESEDFSKVIHFRCHEMGHYANQCPLKNKGKEANQVATGTITSVEED